MIFRKAHLALLATVILWSFAVVVARGIATSIPPMFILFLRLLVAATAFLPFFLSTRPWKKRHFGKLLLCSFLTSINLALFMWGIQFTSASTGQLIYATTPVMIIIISSLLLKEQYPLRKTVGVVLGLTGIFFIVYQSSIESGTTITGSPSGNIAVITAMLCWTLYILFSKRISRYFSPIEIASTSIISSCLLSVVLVLLELTFIKPLVILNTKILLAAFYMGFFGTFLTYLLYQYAIKHTLTLTASLTSYIQTITTALLAMVFLGERLTLNFVWGSSLVFLGIFLATTLEIYHRRK